MKISFDTMAKAVYIEVDKNKVSRTKEFAPGVFLDLDYKGNLVGVEMLSPGRLYFKKIAKKFHVPELTKVRPGVLEKAYAG